MKRKEQGFTLVELLVVIAIIGILATLVTGAAVMARNAAIRGRIRMELNQLQLAVEAYKGKVGEYPPDLLDETAVVRHVKKRWPRYALPGANTAAQYANFMDALNNYYQTNSGILTDLGVPNAANNVIYIDLNARYISAMPIWLGGFPDESGKLAGFSGDPQAPLGRWDDGSGNVTNLINGIDAKPNTNSKVVLESREKDQFCDLTIGEKVSFVTKSSGGSVTHMYPCIANKLGRDTKVPYVYFRGSSEGGTLAYCYLDTNANPNRYEVKFYPFSTTDMSDLGVAAPYARACDPFSGTPKIQWYDPERFQIVHPGQDMVFGTLTNHSQLINADGNNNQPLSDANFRTIDPNAAKNALKKADYDNITNFTEPTIEGLIP